MRTTIIIIATLFLTSCATTDYFVADGDRAAGTVTLVCNYDMLTSCPTEPSPEQKQAAIDACVRWGYSDAQAFGSVRKIPVPEYSESGRLEMVFQCIGDLEK